MIESFFTAIAITLGVIVEIGFVIFITILGTSSGAGFSVWWPLR